MEKGSAILRAFPSNGVDGTTGGYLFPPVGLRDLPSLARRERPDADDRRLHAELRARQARAMGPKSGVDPRRLEETGWGVVFAEGTGPALREALEPLLAHRRRQAGRVEAHRYRELGYRRGESKLHFLARHGATPGPADPDRLPYYLLLAGDPEAIPYRLQYQLDVQYAVGRIAFDDLDGYARYAASVVVAETGEPPRPRRAAFFGVRRPGDVTETLHDHLLSPLAEQLERELPEWEMERIGGGEATRGRLGRLLGGDETPALLFTGSHGLGFERSHPRQQAEQGALVCQEWMGPWNGPPDTSSRPYFTAEDVADSACPAGLVAFCFACYSAGTPRVNDFVHRGDDEPAEIADTAFVARLPQRLLGHPRGGALAVVGHVDRAWTYSFTWPGVEAHREVFASTLRRLLEGHPVGSAMEFFDQRYAELETDLADLRESLELGVEPDLLTLGQVWTARNDARNFVILGDPAVRVPGTGDPGTEAAA